MIPAHLTTDWLHLTAPRLADGSQLCLLANDPLIAEMTLSVPSPYTEAAAVAFLHMAQRGREEATAFIFAIRLSEDGELMGCIGLHLDPKYGHAEIGYWMGAPYRRQGYISEAVAVMVDFGFQYTEVVRIQAIHKLGNVSSGKALLHGGMQREAQLDSYVIKNGAPQTVIQYRILRGEWTAKRPPSGDL